MQGGFLIYKCRRCGKLNKNNHVPDGITALVAIANGSPLPKAWFGTFSVGKTDICSCEDGNLGISDLIGFEKD